MSEIRTIVFEEIQRYDRSKTGKWSKKEPPPSNTFQLNEIYSIGERIISCIEGLLADSALKGTNRLKEV